MAQLRKKAIGSRLVTHVGSSGWFYWHWRGRFYPETLPTHRWFRHYATRFKTVELNAPFYRWPTDATVKGWIRQAPRTFRYSIKVNSLITHEKRLKGTRKLIAKFYRIGDILETKLACFLFQFPPSFRFSASRLKSIVSQLDPRFRNAVEFRHKSWWNPAVYRSLRQHDIIFCSVSAPRLPDKLIKTARQIYLRLHGRSRWYRHNYSTEELELWAARIRRSKAGEAWIYFDNDREAHAISNARKMIRLLKT